MTLLFSINFFLLFLFFINIKTLKFRILHTNDLHSHFLGTLPSVFNEKGDKEFSNSDFDNDPISGHYARIATVFKYYQSKEYPTVTLDAGDFLSGTLFHFFSFSQDFQFSPEFEFFKYLNYDSTILGNHEFDGKLSLLQKIMKKAEGVNLPILTSTLEFEEEEKFEDKNPHSKYPYFTNYITKKLQAANSKEELKVGIIGIQNEQAYRVIAKGNREGVNLKFWDAKKDKVDRVLLTQYLYDLIKFLRTSKNADLIIAVGHEGGKEDKRLLEDLEALAKKNKEEVFKVGKNYRVIDVHCGGHSHKQYFKQLKSEAVTIQNFAYGQSVSNLLIDYDKNTRSLDVINSDSDVLINITKSIPLDPKLNRKITKYKKLIELDVLNSFQGENLGRNSDSSLIWKFPKSAVLKYDWNSNQSRRSFGQFVSDCLIQKINDFEERNEFELTDVYFIPLEFLRISRHILPFFLNGTTVTINDLFRVFGVSNFDGETGLVGANFFTNEHISFFYVTKSNLFTLFSFMELYQYVDHMAQFAFSNSFTYKIRKFGIPFLRSERFGRLYDLKIKGKPFSEIPNDRLFKLAVKKSFIPYLNVLQIKTFGILDIKPLDSFGREIKPFSQNIFELPEFSKCLIPLE